MGANVKEYKDWHARYLRGDAEARRALPTQCPRCDGQLPGHGAYPRKVINIIIPRLRCTQCHVTHAVPPSFLAPDRPGLMALVDQGFRLRREGRSWSWVADAMPEVSLSTRQRWMRRIRHQAETAVARLSRDASRLDPKLDVATRLRPYPRHPWPLGEAALTTCLGACQRFHPDLGFPAGQLLEWAHVHRVSAPPAGLWC